MVSLPMDVWNGVLVGEMFEMMSEMSSLRPTVWNV